MCLVHSVRSVTTYVKPGGSVAKAFECRWGGVQCNARIEGATEEEVLTKAVEHAREKHGVDLAASTTLARYAQSLIRDEPAKASR